MSLLETFLKECGFIAINPWSLPNENWFIEASQIKDEYKRREALHSVNMRVGANNEQAIRECDLIVAVLDGSDVDSGTASEIGFGYALSKKIFGYRSDSRLTGDNEGNLVNLQVQYWIENSDGCITRHLDELHQKLVKMSSTLLQ